MRTTRLASLALLAGIVFTIAPALPLAAQDAPVRVRDSRGWLGFSYGIEGMRIMVRPGETQQTPPEARVVIGEVLKGSPADRAGMEPGDTLVRVNGETASLGRMGDAARRLHPGDTVRLQIRRAGKEHTLTLVAAQRPAYLGPVAMGMGEGRIITIDGDSIRRTMRIYLDSARMKLDSMPFPRMIMRQDSVIIMQYGGKGARADTIRMPRLDSLRRFYVPRMEALGDSVFRHIPNVHIYAGRDVPDGMRVFDVEVAGRRGIAGASVEELSSQLATYFGVREGLLVEGVAAGTPAAKAGLQAGDVVTAADGHAVAGVADLRRALRGRSGDVKLDIVRKGKKQQVQIKWP